MATLGLIGSGNIGSTLARLAVDAGLDVVLSNSIPELEARELTDSEILQRHLAGAHVVKAFNNIHYKHLRDLPRPPCATDRTALPIAGRDPGANKHAAELLSLLGYDSVDMGPLSESWRSQVGTPVFCAPYAVTKDDQYRTQPSASRRRAPTSSRSTCVDRLARCPIRCPLLPSWPRRSRKSRRSDRRILATQADVRDYGALKAALNDGVAQLGRLDIVSANAGIFSFGPLAELPEQKSPSTSAAGLREAPEQRAWQPRDAVRQRSLRKVVRTSSMTASGFSQGTKWPPRACALR